MKRICTITLLALALGAAGCVETIGADDEDAGAPDAGEWTGGDIPPTTGNFTHSVEDGVVTTVVDATDDSTWHPLDLDTGVSTDEGWDLSFSRFRVRVNGGVTGSGGVQVAALDGQAFDDVTQAPEEGWTVPVPDGEDDDDTEADNVFNNGTSDWYDYELETHTLTPRDVTYVVASTDGAFFKLRFLDYYDDAGSPAFVRYTWAPVDPPPSALPDAGPAGPVDAGVEMDAGEDPLPEHAIEVNAGDGASWTYLSLTDGVVSPSDPDTSTDWDVAFRRTEVRTNSGTSGAGLGGARVDASGLAFDDITEATTLGYAVDEVIDSGRPGAEPTSTSPVLGDWYDYDPVTHSVSPSDLTFLVRTATGDYGKLRIWRWADGRYDLSFLPVTRHVERVELDVDASDGASWVYLSLRDGGLVEVTDAATDGAWDVGISRTRVRTNGGTSGGGMGEVAETIAETIDALTDAPTEGWAVDEMVSSGAPGSPEYSGNPVLGGWYDYDPVTHTVSPRPVVFAVRTADGHVGALRILSYADGMHRVALTFAGPGHTSF
ncbi:MAG TPA: HmuY family protein [Sandaracinaceae bacterium LLY-WYZ-13_1]|nr:HmuY family protein [Sandaracinaceae bacterium LLY-WYZ-13_1]